MIARPYGLLIPRSLHSSLSSVHYCLAFLSLAASASASPGFWQDIYDTPTPSANDGPPGSKYATRDKKLLPYQICGILGGYLAFVLITLLLLLTFGRRLRRGAEMSPASLEMQLMGNPPAAKNFNDETPISPASTTRSWMGKMSFRKSSSIRGSVPNSPGVGSVHSFDQSIIDNDKESRQREMERLYAAVMEHDAAKAQKAQLASEEEVFDEDEIQPHPESQPTKVKTDKRPPRLLVKSSDGQSPAPSVQAIYPPTSPRSIHSGASNPAMRYLSPPLSPRNAPPMSPRNVPLPMSPNKPVPSSPRSILSFGSAKSARKALKSLRISGPIKDYPGVADSDESRAPLSPRLYPDPGPAPSPPMESSRRIQSISPRSVPGLEPDYADEELDQPQPLPMTNFSRGPLSPGLQQTMSSSPTSKTNNSLPLRSYNPDFAVPPTPTKVTYLERRKEQLNLMTPRTGVPSTPYSPYMPFTPITPVTPRLMSKKEMKAKKKVEGRRVLSNDDLVQDEKDIWDSGY